MNRDLLGPKWTKRPDERLFAFYFLEKRIVNPHWHALLMIDEPDGEKRERQFSQLLLDAGPAWRALKRSGTVDVQLSDSSEALRRYVAKGLPDEVQYASVVVPRGFDRK